MNKINRIYIGYPPFESDRGVALLSQNRQFQWFKSPTYIYPVVPATAATMIKNAGYKVDFIDAIARNMTTKEWYEYLDSNTPDLLFFEVKTPVIYKAWKIVDDLKAKYKNMIVVIAGDIFDNNFDALDNPERLEMLLSQINSTYGTYAVFGNHDVTETLIAGFPISSKNAPRDPRMYEFLEKSNISVLEDETAIIDNSFYLTGRLDEKRTGNGTKKRASLDELTKNLDPSMPLFVISHEPDHLSDYNAHGVDIVLSGHTHAGQFFPLTIVQPFVWENYWGMKMIDSMYSFVTSGIGVYGPDMRVGTNSEVMVIDVHFE